VPSCIQKHLAIAHLPLTTIQCIFCAEIRFLRLNRFRSASNGSLSLLRNDFSQEFLQVLYLG
jgi:hypothetical protein